tara:strand:- start:245 stop:508 length:264 start_codon:yes stop_codon:yes gene_type:complete
MIQALGVLDILAAIAIIALHFSVHWWKLPVLVMLYLVVKGLSFWRDPQSYVDMFIGIYVWFIFFGFVSFIDYLLAIYLVQKGVASFF